MLLFAVSCAVGWALHYLFSTPSAIEKPVISVVETPQELTASASSEETEHQTHPTTVAQTSSEEQPTDDPDQSFKSQSFMAVPPRSVTKTGFNFPIVALDENILKISTKPANISMPRFSPDGERIVFAAGSEQNHDIWIIDATGGNPVKITDTPSDEIDPSWMADGTKIVYSSNDTGTYELQMMNADGTGKVQITSDGVFDKFHPRCGPILWRNYDVRTRGANNYDGSVILYNAVKDGRSSIWLVGENGSVPTLVIESTSEGKNFIQPEWSPEGLAIIYTCQADGESALNKGWKYKGFFNSSVTENIKQLPVEDGACYPHYITNGSMLTWCNPVKDRTALLYAAADGTGEQALKLKRDISGGFDWSPDGGRFVFVTTVNGSDCLCIQNVRYPFNDVANLWQYGNYSQNQADMLSKNRFVVTGKEHDFFHWLYESYSRYFLNAHNYRIPLFITTDSTLELFHLFFDYALRTVEEEKLLPLLKQLVRGCSDDVEKMTNQAESQDMKNDCIFLQNFFSVAENLLSLAQGSENGLVNRELSLIEGHNTTTESPVLQQKIDYTHFTVRGHYSKNESLGVYFRTMMWLGQAMFRSELNDDPDRALLETRRALLITRMLRNNPALLDRWAKLFTPMHFFVGGADDFHVLSYGGLMDDFFTGDTFDEFYDSDKLNRFRALVIKQEGPRIIPQDGRSFRFMPQRFTPDSYIHQQLVYPEVGTPANPRLLPKGLDIMAVLGSDRAGEILDSVLGETKYHNFDVQTTKLKKEFAAVSSDDWNKNMYWSWLYMLMGLLPEFDRQYPPFMQNKAWQDKSLFTALASWTELRHDTILYVKQSAAEAGEGGEGWEPVIPKPQGYVEPNPEFFRRLENLISLSFNGLNDMELLPGELALKTEKFKGIVARLGRIAEKELRGEPLNVGDNNFVLEYGSELEYLTIFFYDALTSIYDQNIALIADVATDRINNLILHEAVGKVREMDVIVPVKGRKQINRGGIFTYYEFPVKGKRLTDDDWKAMLNRRKAPGLPVWTESFIAEK